MTSKERMLSCPELLRELVNTKMVCSSMTAEAKARLTSIIISKLLRYDLYSSLASYLFLFASIDKTCWDYTFTDSIYI